MYNFTNIRIQDEEIHSYKFWERNQFKCLGVTAVILSICALGAVIKPKREGENPYWWNKN